MKRTLWITLVVACGGKEPAPATPSNTVVAPDAAPAAPAVDAETVLGTLTYFRDMMCGCADRPCAEKVEAQKVAGAEPTEPTQATDRQRALIFRLGNDYAKCMELALNANTP